MENSALLLEVLKHSPPSTLPEATVQRLTTHVSFVIAAHYPSTAISSHFVQAVASQLTAIDTDALLVNLLAFHYQQQKPSPTTTTTTTTTTLSSCAFNVVALLLSQFTLQDNHSHALKFLSYHLHHVSPCDPTAFALLQSTFAPLLPSPTADLLRSLVLSSSESACTARAAHLLSVITKEGDPQITASPIYVKTIFDELAPVFESRLVKDLSYSVPHDLFELVLNQRLNPNSISKILDLGCGTGLVGAEFASLKSSATPISPAPQFNIVLEADHHQIMNKIEKLLSSNLEMEEFDPEKTDSTIQEAIVENQKIIEFNSDEAFGMKVELGLASEKGFWLGGCDLSPKMCEITRCRRNVAR